MVKGHVGVFSRLASETGLVGIHKHRPAVVGAEPDNPAIEAFSSVTTTAALAALASGQQSIDQKTVVSSRLVRPRTAASTISESGISARVGDGTSGGTAVSFANNVEAFSSWQV